MYIECLQFFLQCINLNYMFYFKYYGALPRGLTYKRSIHSCIRTQARHTGLTPRRPTAGKSWFLGYR